jgi:hypothetical protein
MFRMFCSSSDTALEDALPPVAGKVKFQRSENAPTGTVTACENGAVLGGSTGRLGML